MATMVLRGKHKIYGYFGTPFPTLDEALELTFGAYTLDEDGEISVNGERIFEWYDDMRLEPVEEDNCSNHDCETVERQRYKYGMRLRGFSIGCQPMDGLADHYECTDNNKYYDYIVYNRKLSDKEVHDYELDYLGVI